MHSRYFLFLPVILLLSMIYSATVSAGTIPRLEKLPIGEQWFVISFSDERSGFSYVRVTPDDSGYELYSESAVKMGGFAFSRDATVREKYMVNPDLTLRSFDVNQTIDGKPMSIRGKAGQAGIKMVIESGGAEKEKLLKSKKPVYPPMALTYLPLARGIKPGGKMRISMLDTEAAKLKNVMISVVGNETHQGVKALHIRTDLYPVDDDIWVDAKGNLIEESVRDGWIVTRAEQENSVRKFISEAVLSGRDFMGNFSLVTVDKPISNPVALKKLAVEISGYPADAGLVTDDGQTAKRLPDGKVLVTIENSTARNTANQSEHSKALEEFLKPAAQTPTEAPLINSTEAEITGGEKDPVAIAEKLCRWVASNIKKTDSGIHSPLEVLDGKKGTWADMTRLYVALARAAGLPTKTVSGLVYVTDRGFLYRSWAESYVGYWMPVDPVIGETPADVTHIGLVEGDTDDALVTLSRFIGHIHLKLVEEE